MGVMDARRRILLNAPHIVTPTSAGLVSFSTDMIAPLKECKVHFSPVQSGTGDPSPTNNRPISGWDGVTVEKCGKNLFDGTVSRFGFGSTASSVTGYEIVTANSAVGYYCECKPGEILTLSRANGSATPRFSIGFTKEIPSNHTVLYNLYTPLNNTNTSITMTAPDDVKYVCLYLSNIDTDISAAKIQLEYGSTATDYEPYQSRSTLPISWQTEAGTIYGGYFDLAAGEVVEEWASVDLGTLDWYNVDTSYGKVAYSLTLNKVNAVGANDVYFCDRYKYEGICVSNNGASLYGSGSCSVYVGPDKRFYINDSSFAEYTNAQVKAALNGVQLVYPLATPIHHTIDPATLRTLRGVNNVWANTNGTIDLSYWTH